MINPERILNSGTKACAHPRRKTLTKAAKASQLAKEGIAEGKAMNTLLNTGDPTISLCPGVLVIPGLGQCLQMFEQTGGRSLAMKPGQVAAAPLDVRCPGV